MLQNFTQEDLVLAENPWNNLGNGKLTCVLVEV